MKKFITFIGISSLILFGCSGEDIQDTEATASQESSEKVYETKDLKFDDLKDIEIGDSVEKVYEQLGEPLKKWSSEFVYEELEALVYRNEAALAILGDLDPELSAEHDYVIEQAEKSLEIDKLTLLQYTYTYEEDTEETALYWISPRTDTIVAEAKRKFIDGDGKEIDAEDNDIYSSENTDYTEEKGSNNSSVAEVGWEIGGYVQYETDDGLQYNIQPEQFILFVETCANCLTAA
ncbi:hypothetical protein HZY86_07050 [Aerococcaceae bacterium DSM 111020]|nr:hypothetical protein [Aerococcaceae bacterium DSM 111020]